MNDISTAFPIRHTSNGVDEYLRRGAELRNQQRKRVLDLQDEHQRKRTALTVEYARKMNDIAAEGVEALQALDHQHELDLRAEEEKLAALDRQRG